MLAVFVALLALGSWQVRRRAWKLELIAQVEQRVHAPPTPAPGPNRWAGVSAASDAYRRVRVRGVFLNDGEVRVRALTELGAGYWVMTPLRTSQDFTVLINRGFVPPEKADPITRRSLNGPVTVTGLLRITEPGGGFLERNAPVQGRWYSRDVAAIAAARRLTRTAPYFIDADATPNPGGLPVGGLTVIAFPNSHLLYAITWYTLAAMVAGGAALVVRQEWRAGRGVA